MFRCAMRLSRSGWGHVIADPLLLPCRCIFLPLDVTWPQSRLQQIIADAQPAVVLHSHGLGSIPYGNPELESYVASTVHLATTTCHTIHDMILSKRIEPFPTLLPLTETILDDPVPFLCRAHARTLHLSPGYGRQAHLKWINAQWGGTSAFQPTTPLGESGSGSGPNAAESKSRAASGTVLGDDVSSMPYCYIMYTSGSTGVPMGVCGTEEGAVSSK